MAKGAGKVTLVFARVGDDWTKEPVINLVAAAATGSRLTHTEIAIGDSFDSRGMANVLRIYNDPVGVELVSRTGLNPLNSYIEVGCSKAAEERMLDFGRAMVGRPFSNYGMVRSVIWPRTTDHRNFFCAELTAACLKAGGLLGKGANPGSYTPSALYKLFQPRAAATGNPLVLQRAMRQHINTTMYERCAGDTDVANMLARKAVEDAARTSSKVKNMNVVAGRAADTTSGRIFTLNSLDMRHVTKRHDPPTMQR